MNRYQDIVGRINYGLFLTVVALLPYPQIFLRYACVLWIISWYLEGRWLGERLKGKGVYIPFLLFGLWYAWHALSGLWADDPTAWAMQMERYMAFGLMVPVGIWGVNRFYKPETTLRVLAVTAWIVVPIYLLILIFQWDHQTGLVDFMAENISHIKHRLFLCTVELAGILAAIKLWKHRPFLLSGALLTMMTMVVLSGSRQAILTVASVGALLLIYALPKPYRLRYGVGILLIGLMMGVGILSLHPRMQELGFNGLTNMRELSYYHDLRLNVWGAALQSPSDYLAYGVGGGQSPHYLAQHFQEAQMPYYAQAGLHAHNQYLEEMMEIGLPGLLLFLLAWCTVPFCARGEGRRTAWLFTTVFAISMLTDCMFGKFDGIAIWATVLVLILFQSDTEGDEQSSRDAETH